MYYIAAPSLSPLRISHNIIQYGRPLLLAVDCRIIIHVYGEVPFIYFIYDEDDDVIEPATAKSDFPLQSFYITLLF